MTPRLQIPPRVRFFVLAPIALASCALARPTRAQDASADRVPRGTVQSPLRKLRETGDAPAPESPGVSSKIQRYSENLIKKFDRDSDGKLSTAEIDGLGESLRVSDFNRDGFITSEEFTRRIMAYSRRRSIRITPLAAPSPILSAANAQSATPLGEASGSQPGDVNAAASVEPAKPRQFVVAPGRLPTTLPEWFAKADANGDGQVSLAELSTNGSVAATEFSKLDADGDGLITAQESIRAADSKSAEAPAAPAQDAALVAPR